MRFLCWVNGHLLVIPTEWHCYEPIHCARCGWELLTEEVPS